MRDSLIACLSRRLPCASESSGRPSGTAFCRSGERVHGFRAGRCARRESADFSGISTLTDRHKKWVSYLYRTATTAYPCCLPTLGDSAGAGRIRLTRYKSRQFYPIRQTISRRNPLFSYICSGNGPVIFRRSYPVTGSGRNFPIRAGLLQRVGERLPERKNKRTNG